MPSTSRFRYLEALPPHTQSGPSRPESVLLLLHAFPLNAGMWEQQLALAELGWRVIAPDLAGFGDSPASPVSSMDDYAGGVVDLLDALHIHQAVVGGLSMGGYVAFAMMRHATRYVRALVLSDTRSQADTPEGVEGRRRMLALLEEKGPAGVADEMIPKLLGSSTLATSPEIVARVRSLILSNSAEAIAGAIRALMSRPDSTPLLHTIHCPTLIIVGEDDTLTPPGLSREMHTAIAGSELVTIPGAGHLTSMEQPAAFNDALAGFLSHRV